MSNIFKKLKRLIDVDNKLNTIEYRQQLLLTEIEHLKIINSSYQLFINNNLGNINNIRQVEFKVFSQWGDDGIIQYLIQHLDINNQQFIEFGVENYREATTRFLLMNNNWSGLVIDGSEENIHFIKHDPIYYNYDLQALCSIVTADSINDLIRSVEIQGEVGLLHIDIDGNDYWVWKAIQIVQPVIVIVEYNAVFGNTRSITVPYQPDFIRTRAHYSNLYFGASLPALCDLADEKGYCFIGCTSNGNNAYFIRKDRMNSLSLPVLTAREGFIDSKFRESRDETGKLTFVSGADRIKIIQGLPVYNTSRKCLETL